MGTFFKDLVKFFTKVEVRQEKVIIYRGPEHQEKLVDDLLDATDLFNDIIQEAMYAGLNVFVEIIPGEKNYPGRHSTKSRVSVRVTKDFV